MSFILLMTLDVSFLNRLIEHHKTKDKPKAMTTETKIEKIRAMINANFNKSIRLIIGSALENVAFECACNGHDSLILDRKITHPLANVATYTIRKN